MMAPKGQEDCPKINSLKPLVDLYLISEKKNLEKLNSTNWLFSLFQTGFLQPVFPGKINFKIDFCRLEIQFHLIFPT